MTSHVYKVFLHKNGALMVVAISSGEAPICHVATMPATVLYCA